MTIKCPVTVRYLLEGCGIPRSALLPESRKQFWPAQALPWLHTGERVGHPGKGGPTLMLSKEDLLVMSYSRSKAGGEQR